MAAQNPQEVSPEEFAQLVKGASDEEIAATVHQAGTAGVLDRIFEGMEERFVPEKASDVDADIVFEINDGEDSYPYVVAIHNQTCKAEQGTKEDPKVKLTTGLVPFVKLVTGEAQGPQLFMSGKLKVSGDLMFSTRIMTFFDQPKAS
ncbi:MAG: SCP2 sterol-binding domain-containing protein [Actinomycetota bacterium]